jgi:hypothetical protein
MENDVDACYGSLQDSAIPDGAQQVSDTALRLRVGKVLETDAA